MCVCMCRYINHQVILLGDTLKKMMNIFFFVLCFIISHVSYNVHCIQDTLKEDVKFETKSKLTIKSSVKTIHVFHNLINFLPILSIFLS